MDKELLGIELPMDTWKKLFLLAEEVDRLPSDYLRILIQREAAQLASVPQLPAPTGQEVTTNAH